MSHTCSGAGGPWLIYKSSVFGWVAEWHKSVSKWLPPSSWLRGHDTRMGEPLIHSQKNGLKPIIVFNNDTIQSYMLWEQCCKSWRRPDDLKYLIILCLLGRWRRWSKWWRKGAREWWWLWLDHRTILPPHLCQLLTILCSGFQICCLPFQLEASYFVLKEGALLNQLNCGFHRLSTNIKDRGSEFECSVTYQFRQTWQCCARVVMTLSFRS